MSVANVITRDTKRDITDLMNEAAERYGFDVVGFLGGAIAESSLDEHSFREQTWPDVSYGLFHSAVKWIGPEVNVQRHGTPPTALDTPENRRIVREYLWDAERAIAYTAPRYSALLKAHGTPLEAWCRWNKPNTAGEANPNRPTYMRGLAAAENYRSQDMAQDDNVNASEEIKTKLHAAGDYAILASRFEVVTFDGQKAEIVQGTKGEYVSSPIDGWVLHGPFGVAG